MARCFHPHYCEASRFQMASANPKSVFRLLEDDFNSHVKRGRLALWAAFLQSLTVCLVGKIYPAGC